MRYPGLLLGLLLILAPAGAAEAPPLLSALDKEVADLAARALPGVVRVRVRTQFEAPPPPPQGIAPGQAVAAVRHTVSRFGFVWDANGRIVAAGIPDGTAAVEVLLHDGREVEGKVLGNDPLTQLAVVQVAVEGLQPLPLGDAAGLRPGSWMMVLAGAEESGPAPYPVTLGAVEARGDCGGQVLSLVAGSLPAAPGGPVLNARGEVVGVLVATTRRGGQGEGIALSVASARAVLEQLAAGQPVKRGFLGVAINALTPELRKLAGLADAPGVFVQHVTDKGPAAAAGLQDEDVILAVNGVPAKSLDDLMVAIQALPPGREALLQVWRKKEKLEVKVVLGEMPQPARRAQADFDAQLRLGPAAPPPGPRVFVVSQGGVRPDARMVTLDIQAKSLLEAVALVLNGTGFPFRVDPAVLGDAAAVEKPFGFKATNTPLSQVLDHLCAHYGLAWQVQSGVIDLRKQ